MRTLATVAPFGFDFEIGRLLSAYATLGCVGAQFYRPPEMVIDPTAVVRTVEAAGLRLDSIHGVFGKEIDPSSPDDAHREECIEIYRREGEVAQSLGVEMVVVHPAAYFSDDRALTPDEARTSHHTRQPFFEDFARRLADVGETLNVTYLIENLPFNAAFGHDPALLATQVVGIESARLRMCFDTGHAHVTGDVAEALRDAAPAISYLHVHDNDAVLDDHRMPGRGTIAWSDVSKALRDAHVDVPCMLEVFEDAEGVEALAKTSFAEELCNACAIDGRGRSA